MDREIDYEAMLVAAETLLKSDDPVKQAFGRWTMRKLEEFAKPGVFEKIIRNGSEP
jgi:hypothetical protein